jgi:hypothetical protein
MIQAPLSSLICVPPCFFYTGIVADFRGNFNPPFWPDWFTAKPLIPMGPVEPKRAKMGPFEGELHTGFIPFPKQRHKVA